MLAFGYKNPRNLSLYLLMDQRKLPLKEIHNHYKDYKGIAERMEKEAKKIAEEDIEMNKIMNL